MSKTAACLTAALTVILSGCGSGRQPAAPEPIIRTVEVLVPVDNPTCAREAIVQLGSVSYPDTPEAVRTAPDIFERVKLILAGREMRKNRIKTAERLLKACADRSGND